MARDRHHLSAADAASALGITRATLYAYTSRGLLRSEPVPGTTRERRYLREDVDRLRDRKAARRDPAKAAAHGLRWGEPVLESGITLIHGGTYYYRGHDAVALARTATIEDAAALLWEAPEGAAARLFSPPPHRAARSRARLTSLTSDARVRMQLALPLAAVEDAAGYDLRPAGVRLTGARILRLLTSAVVGGPVEGPMHRALQDAWVPRRRAAAEAIRTALVLSADHELNISAFSARCTASAGASPYDVVTAALATLKGFRHGGASERARALVRQAGSEQSARAALAERLRQGEHLPGFGHPLYPAGDPRARVLLELAEANATERAWRPFRNLVRAGASLLDDAPNLDLGLAAVAHACGLPDEAPFLLFALGRTVGWIAHAMEEYAAGRLIRPRARYVGPTPAA